MFRQQWSLNQVGKQNPSLGLNEEYGRGEKNHPLPAEVAKQGSLVVMYFPGRESPGNWSKLAKSQRKAQSRDGQMVTRSGPNAYNSSFISRGTSASCPILE